MSEAGADPMTERWARIVKRPPPEPLEIEVGDSPTVSVHGIPSLDGNYRWDANVGKWVPASEWVDSPTVSEPRTDPALEALRHLFFVMERLDRQAGPPFSDDHLVKITAESWLDLVRPAIETVRRRLQEQTDDR